MAYGRGELVLHLLNLLALGNVFDDTDITSNIANGVTQHRNSKINRETRSIFANEGPFALFNAVHAWLHRKNFETGIDLLTELGRKFFGAFGDLPGIVPQGRRMFANYLIGTISQRLFSLAI